MRAYLALAFAMMLTGANVALGKIVIEHVPPASFAMLRFTLSSLCLVPLALREPGGIASLHGLKSKQWLELVLLSLFGVVGFTTLMLIGIQYTPAINAGIITSALPAIIAFLSFAILREPLSRRGLFAIGLAVLGILSLNLAKPAHANPAATAADLSLTMLGNGLVLAAVTSEAIFAILTRRYSSLIPPWTLTMIVHLIGIPLTIPLLFWQDGGWVLPQADLSFWLLATYYIFTASVLSFYFWCLGIKTVPASTGAIFTALVPLTTLVIALVALDEHLVMLQMIGLGAILASLLIGLKGSRAE